MPFLELAATVVTAQTDLTYLEALKHMATIAVTDPLVQANTRRVKKDLSYLALDISAASTSLAVLKILHANNAIPARYGFYNGTLPYVFCSRSEFCFD